VYAPVEGARFEETRALARALAAALAAEDPRGVTGSTPLAGRAGKVLVD
jgi:DNA primase